MEELTVTDAQRHTPTERILVYSLTHTCLNPYIMIIIIGATYIHHI